MDQRPSPNRPEPQPLSPQASEEPQRLSLWRRYRRLSLGVKILIYMVVGVIIGIIWPGPAMALQPLGDLFIRLLMMAAIPLVFFNLLGGLTSLQNMGVLGRLGAKIALFYLFTTTMALSLGLAVMHLLRPGEGMTLEQGVDDDFGEIPGIVDILLDMVPANVVRAFADGNIVQIVVFAIFLGVATLVLPAKQRQPLAMAFGAMADALRKLVGIIMKFGPIGIGALAAATVGEYGSQIFGPLAMFLAGVWSAQACMFLVQMGVLRALSDLRPIEFLKRTGQLYATAAATCSSLATLAVALDIAGKRLRLPASIYSFTLPLGAQLNKDGTSIMLAGVLLFTAQAAGIEMTLGEIIVILLVGLTLSMGSGGIPGGGLVIAMIFVQAFNLPLEMAVIVGGIYRLIDTGSTTINVTGDMVGTTVVAHSEGWRIDQPPEDENALAETKTPVNEQRPDQ